MTKKEYKDFTDLRVWQKSRDAVLAVFELVDKIPDSEKPVLGNETKSLSLKVARFIGEAHYAYGKEARIATLSEAKRTLNALHSNLLMFRELELIKSKDLEPVLEEVGDCRGQLIGFIKYFAERDQAKEAQSA
ncbi:MAG: four helix bundle protein [Bacteroidota bacterium]